MVKRIKEKIYALMRKLERVRERRVKKLLSGGKRK